MFKANINNNSSQHELLSCCFCDHPSPNINKLWLLLLCYLRVRFQLASPPGFHFNTSRRRTLYIYINVFFTLRHFFLFRPRVFPRALGSVAHREPSRTQYASLGPGLGPWHVLWGLKVARPLGEAFRARRAIQAHVNSCLLYTSDAADE